MDICRRQGNVESKSRAIDLGRFITSKTELCVIFELKVNYSDVLLQGSDNLNRISQNDEYSGEQVRKRTHRVKLLARSLYYYL
jgi:hypothetical protein